MLFTPLPSHSSHQIFNNWELIASHTHIEVLKILIQFPITNISLLKLSAHSLWCGLRFSTTTQLCQNSHNIPSAMTSSTVTWWLSILNTLPIQSLPAELPPPPPLPPADEELPLLPANQRSIVGLSEIEAIFKMYLKKAPPATAEVNMYTTGCAANILSHDMTQAIGGARNRFGDLYQLVIHDASQHVITVHVACTQYMCMCMLRVHNNNLI